MKVAIPTRGTVVDDHFGHCEKYTIYTIGADNHIESTETLPSPQGCGCKSNIAAELREKGVKVMLAGNMGEGAMKNLVLRQIEVIRGCKGEVDELIAAYLQGRINDSGVGCDHHHDHGADHVCSK
ncbi:NifB/NifX family molybdenum-iron cluster-binding protein [Parabacteroides sp. FAFU027]|uniref:NifB/NifX family molybdenum-iron cluster-binding protein n=1 Tax=Parabacteroides sp. FAFU027 TaxID=2922715 RepID=UPI001FAFF33A|nr:NifB/NifX family molybdenum-iron cluster-binding protein [Parabacteroides sp. FAFU027]